MVDNDQRITYWNSGAERQYGLRSGEVLGKLLGEVNQYHWVKPEDEALAYESLSATGSWFGENLHVKKNGEIICVESSVRMLRDESGGNIGMLAVMRDITRRKHHDTEISKHCHYLEEMVERRTQELKRANEKLQREMDERKQVEEELKLKAMLVDAANDSIMMVDLSGTIIFANEAAYNLRGYNKGELVGINLRDLETPEHAKLVSVRIMELLEKGESIFETSTFRKDKSIIHLENNNRIVESCGKKLILTVGREITDRKQAEKALQESEEKYRTLFESTGTAIGIVEEDMTICLASKELEELSGYPKEEIEGKKKWAEFVYEDDLDRIKKYHFTRRVDPGTAPRSHEFRFINRYGNIRNVFAVVSMIAGTKNSVVSLIDITERKKAEEELYKHEKELETLLTNIPDVITRFDKEHRHLYINPAIEQFTGIPSREFLGKTNQELGGTQENIDLWEKSLRSVFVTGNPVTIEFSFSKHGRERYFQSRLVPEFGENNTIQSVLAIARDITERKQMEDELRKHRNHLEELVIERTRQITLACEQLQQEITERKFAEEALRESEEIYRSLVETSPDAITLTDLGGVILVGNQQSAVLHGFETIEEYIGKNAFYLIAPEHRELALENAKKTLETGSIRDIEYKMLKKDGSFFPAELSSSMVIDAKGKPKGFIAVFRDITERKKAEKEILDKQWELRSLASELSMAEERERRVIATDVHDSLGQPLAMAKIKLGMLRAMLTLAEHIDKVKEIRILVEEAIRYCRALTSELGSPILYELGYGPAVESLCEQFHEQYGINISFKIDKEPRPIDIEIGVIIFKAVRELLSNVVKHSNANIIKVIIQNKEGYIYIQVKDDGIGFDNALLRFNINRQTGFGLFSLGERLKYLGGRLKIDSAPGRGTNITLEAPLTLNI